eukprot:TRINITY_DN911_c0_g1_i1.p1 TRINITY_DN911_c0_g1~~TRINITY_DN911_c0_g1_i1.p1  ORF type:complete len:563 (-),score=107.22 TRINITY_DN911_c0_g1_i1:50-1738(-)
MLETPLECYDTQYKTSPHHKNKKSEVYHLQSAWTLWFDEGFPKGITTTDYLDHLVNIGSFSTVQDFWRYWNNIKITQLPEFSNLRLFKAGIKPTWEDPANVNGGKWVFHYSKDVAEKMWIHIVLALIGEKFDYGEDMCGTVYSVRPKKNTLNLWVSNSDLVHVESTNKTLRYLLNLQESDPVSYQPHSGSLAVNDNYCQLRKSRSMSKIIKESLELESTDSDRDFRSENESSEECSSLSSSLTTSLSETSSQDNNSLSFSDGPDTLSTHKVEDEPSSLVELPVPEKISTDGQKDDVRTSPQSFVPFLPQSLMPPPSPLLPAHPSPTVEPQLSKEKVPSLSLSSTPVKSRIKPVTPAPSPLARESTHKENEKTSNNNNNNTNWRGKDKNQGAGTPSMGMTVGIRIAPLVSPKHDIKQDLNFRSVSSPVEKKSNTTKKASLHSHVVPASPKKTSPRAPAAPQSPNRQAPLPTTPKRTPQHQSRSHKSESEITASPKDRPKTPSATGTGPVSFSPSATIAKRKKILAARTSHPVAARKFLLLGFCFLVLFIVLSVVVFKRANFFT